MISKDWVTGMIIGAISVYIGLAIGGDFLWSEALMGSAGVTVAWLAIYHFQKVLKK